MATKTQKTINTTKYVTRKVSGREAIQELRRNIRIYEHRYEVSSEQMLEMVSSGEVRETAEILKWMQGYHVLTLLEAATRTAGTHTTTTEQSTKNA